MGLFKKNRTDGLTYDGQGFERKGMIDRIVYNGESTDLVWKFPYNNLSIGTQLIVNQSQEAVFLKGGEFADVFGPGTHTLSANNLPILQKLVNLPFGGRTPFTAEVWFVNKTVKRTIKFGTVNPVPVRDPLYNNLPIPVRAYGEYGVSIIDSTTLLNQLVGTLHLFDMDSIEEEFRSAVLQSLNAAFGKFVRQENITVIDLPMYGMQMSKFMREQLKDEMAQYGIQLENFNFASITYDQNDANVKRIMDAQASTAVAAHEAQAEVISAQGRAQRRAVEGYTYQQERQFDVMQDAANNEGGNASQFMGAGIGMGMGLGLGNAFGTQMGNVASVMNTGQGAPTPPPPPMPASYYVLVNGVQQGPYPIPSLTALVQQGALQADTLVWKNGMPQWAAASTCPDLQHLFGATPPPPPPPAPNV